VEDPVTYDKSRGISSTKFKSFVNRQPRSSTFSLVTREARRMRNSKQWSVIDDEDPLVEENFGYTLFT
jgi:hypothetical protein